MKLAFSLFAQSFKIFNKDKMLILLSMFPILIGFLLYSLIGRWLYTDVLDYFKLMIEDSVSKGGLGTFVYYLVVSIMSIALYFIVSWTFVLIVSLVSSPFNDIISERVEKVINNEELPSLSNSFKDMLQDISKIIINEIKKISFILLVSLVVVLLNFIPLLTPISFILSAYLLAANFIDYSWARHNFTLKQCLGDIKKSFVVYAIAGSIFTFLMMIPVLNIIFLPYGVVYFTLVFVKKNAVRS